MKKIYIMSIMGLLAMASCTNSDDVEATQSSPIELAAAIADRGAETRAAYTLTTPTTENPLNAAVWVSTTSHSYPGKQVDISEDATSIDYHNTATFTGARKQLLNTQMYYIANPNNEVPVYLVGLYPQTGWTVSSVSEGTSNAASYTFTGCEDVMYAPEVSNSLKTSASYPTLQFGHLLTWLRIFVYADAETTAASWGNITSISIASTNTVTVNTNGDTKTFTNSSGSSGSLNAYVTGTNTAFTGQSQEIGLSSQEIAYVLCAPADASSADTDKREYKLTVTTSGHNAVSVPINLTASGGSDYAGNTAGHQFSVTLKFVQGDVIRTVATVTDWDSQGASVTPVSD